MATKKALYPSLNGTSKKPSATQNDGYGEKKNVELTAKTEPESKYPSVGTIQSPKIPVSTQVITDAYSSSHDQKATFPLQKPVSSVSNPSADNSNIPPHHQQPSANDMRTTLSNLPIEQIPPKEDFMETFQYMVMYGLTIRIHKGGYTRQLFPHWAEKQWNLSQVVNERMLEIFRTLYNASTTGKMTTIKLDWCVDTLKDLTDGLYGYLLPDDYPFFRIMKLIRHKINPALRKAKEERKDEFKFAISERSIEMMLLIKVQVE